MINGNSNTKEEIISTKLMAYTGSTMMEMTSPMMDIFSLKLKK